MCGSALGAGQLARYDTYTEEIEIIGTTEGSSPISALALVEDEVWIGSSEGVHRYDSEAGTLMRASFERSVQAMCASAHRPGKLWIGARGEVVGLEPARPAASRERYQLPDTSDVCNGARRSARRLVGGHRIGVALPASTDGLFWIKTGGAHRPLS